MHDEDPYQWMTRPPGKLVLEQGAEILREWVLGVFGYRLAQLGRVPWGEVDPLQPSPIRQRITTAIRPDAAAETNLVSEPTSLPFAGDSLDLIVLPFTLDFCGNPKQVLREVERVLIPGGRLMVLNFNPWSLWGMRRLTARMGRRPAPPWTGSFIGYVQFNDWLNLLGLEVERTEVAVFRPPVSRESMLRRTAFVEAPGRRFWPMLAAVYAVQAIKRVQPLTHVRSARRRLGRFGNGILEPTTRGV